MVFMLSRCLGGSLSCKRIRASLKKHLNIVICATLILTIVGCVVPYLNYNTDGSDSEEAANQPALALGLLAIALLLLAFPFNLASSIVFLSLSILYLHLDIVDESTFLECLSSKNLFGIAVLYSLSKILAETRIVSQIVPLLLRRPDKKMFSHALFLPLVAFMSAFINNTPLVALLVPTIERWSVSSGAALNWYLFPISFAAMLGGMCTTVGTSINLFAQNLAENRWPNERFHFFGPTLVGLPVAVAGLLFLICTARCIFPKKIRKRPYIPRSTAIFRIDEKMSGKTLLETGIMKRTGIILWHIISPSKVVVSSPSSSYEEIDQAPPAQIELEFVVNNNEANSNIVNDDLNLVKETRLSFGDRLFFVGVPEALENLTSSLIIEDSNWVKKHLDGSQLMLFEIKIADHCDMIRRTIQDFEDTFETRVVAINRLGQTIHELDDLLISANDLVLVEIGCLPAILFNSNQYDCNPVPYYRPKQHSILKRIVFWISVVVAIVVSALDIAPIFVTAFWSSVVGLLLGLCKWREALSAVDAHVLLTVFCSLVIGQGLENSGAAQLIADQLITALASQGAWSILCSAFLTTLILTSFVSNVAAMSIVFSIFAPTADILNISPQAITWTLAIAASCSFILPTGYQCNMMVTETGGYSMWEFSRVGIPLSIISILVGVTAAWIAYPANLAAILNSSTT